MNATQGSEEDRFRLAQESYKEVLDATKHQDDKIGRFLTAIAFLFTGTVAFLARTEVLGVRYQLDAHVLPLPAILIGLFLVLSVFSVMLLLTGLGPNLKLPLPERERDENGEPLRTSRLYFYSISGMTPEQWKDLWRPPHPSISDMTDTYVDETHNLATKTDFKYSRTNEARALFTLGLMFLALAVVLGFKALSRDAASAAQVLPWDHAARGYASAIIGAFALMLGYDYLRFEQELDSWFDRRKYKWRLAPLYFLVIAVPTLVVALVYVGRRPHDFVLWGGSALSVVAIGVPVVYGPPQRRSGWIWRLAFGLPIAAVAFELVRRFLRADDYTPRIILALTAIAVLELPRMLIASLLWHRRRRRARGNAKLPRLFLASYLWPRRGQGGAEGGGTQAAQASSDTT